MGALLKNCGLVSLGVIAGLTASLQYVGLTRPPPASAIAPELRELTDVIRLIRSDYAEPVDSQQLVSGAIGAMVASLDAHSSYLDKKGYAELRTATEGRFVGLGIEIAHSGEGAIRIVAPLEDSPAYRAGILPGDLITEIDAQPIQVLGIDGAIEKMRGAAHTRVALTITRGDVAEPLNFIIAREEIVQKSVKGKIVEPGYGWLRVAQFQEPTLGDLAARLAILYRQEPELKGLVLDLRDDPGGLLQGAIGVAAAFLPKDAAIVATDGQLPDAKQTFYNRPEFYALRGDSDVLAHLPGSLKSVPLVVLVNTGSASASEIVAAVLQESGRASILGSQTFGKGSVQTIRPLSNDAALKLTTARYYTPAGRSIQAAGIVPDFLVDEDADGDDGTHRRLREADLDKHLAQGRGAQPGAAPQRASEDPMRAPAMAPERKAPDYGGVDDFQLRQALNHLKGLPLALSKHALTPAPASALAHQDRARGATTAQAR